MAVTTTTTTTTTTTLCPRFPLLFLGALLFFLSCCPSLTHAGPHLPPFYGVPDMDHDPTKSHHEGGGFTHQAEHQDVHGGATALRYHGKMREETLVLPISSCVVTCGDSAHMTAACDDAELMARIVPGVLLIAPADHGCAPIATNDGTPRARGHSSRGKSVHREVLSVRTALPGEYAPPNTTTASNGNGAADGDAMPPLLLREGALIIETSPDIHGMHMFETLKVHFEHVPGHPSSMLHTEDEHLRYYGGDHRHHQQHPLDAGTTVTVPRTHTYLGPNTTTTTLSVGGGGGVAEGPVSARSRRATATLTYGIPALRFPILLGKTVWSAIDRVMRPDQQIYADFMWQFSVSFTLDFEYDWETGITLFRVSVGGECKININLEVILEKDLELVTKKIASLFLMKLSPILIPVGPIVLWFDQQIELKAVVQAHLNKGELETGVSFDRNIEVGVEYTPSRGWRAIKTFGGTGFDVRAMGREFKGDIATLKLFIIPQYTAKFLSIIPFFVKLLPWVTANLHNDVACPGSTAVSSYMGLTVKAGIDEMSIGVLQLVQGTKPDGKPVENTGRMKFVESALTYTIPPYDFGITVIDKTKILGPWCIGPDWPVQPDLSTIITPGDDSKPYLNPCRCNTDGKSGGALVPKGCNSRDVDTGEDYCYTAGGKSECKYGKSLTGWSKQSTIPCVPEFQSGLRCAMAMADIPYGTSTDMVYFVVDVLDGTGISNSLGLENLDLYVKVRVTPPPGNSAVFERRTTTKWNTGSPRWNEKIIFGPLPADTGVGFQLWDKDTVYVMNSEDYLYHYIPGRKWNCDGGGTRWPYARLGSATSSSFKSSETFAVYMDASQRPDKGSFRVKVSLQRQPWKPIPSDSANAQRTCSDMCDGEYGSFLSGNSLKWCKRACKVYNPDRRAHLDSKVCASETGQRYGPDPDYDRASRKGCIFARKVWDNTKPTPVTPYEELPQTVEGPPEDNGANLGPVGWDNFDKGTKPVAGQTFTDCKAPPSINDNAQGFCDEFTGGCCPKQDMASVNLNGKTVQVHRDAQRAFMALNELFVRHKYQVRSAGGFCCRCIKRNNACVKRDGEVVLSNHAYGTAVDVNSAENPFKASTTVTINGQDVPSKGMVVNSKGELEVETDMPTALIKDIRDVKTIDQGKSIFVWGGDYRSVKDPMHFEINPQVSASELYDRFGGHDVPIVSPDAACKDFERIMYPSIQLCPAGSDGLSKREYTSTVSERAPLIELGNAADKDRTISANFKVGDYAGSGKFFRMDPALVQCVQSARASSFAEYGNAGRLKVVSAYINQDEETNPPLDSFSDQNLYQQYSAGLAVAIAFTNGGSTASLYTLARAVVKSCYPLVESRSLMLGVGLYPDRLHVDFRAVDAAWAAPGATNAEGQSVNTDEFMDQVFRWRHPGIEPEGLPDCTGVKSVPRGDTWPKDSTPAGVCGPADERVLRDSGRAVERLTRVRSANIAINDNLGHGYVVPRMHVKLGILSRLLTKHAQSGKATVTKSWVNNPMGNFDPTNLHVEARAVQLSPDASVNIDTLSRLARCAGFDFVEARSSSLLLAVRKQRARIANIGVFPEALNFFLEVAPSWHAPSVVLKHQDMFEMSEMASPLFDGYGRTDERLTGPTDIHLETTAESGFTVADFLSDPTDRYFRLHSFFANCLQEAEDQVRLSQGAKGLRVRKRVLSVVSTEFSQRREGTGRSIEVEIVHGQPRAEGYADIEHLAMLIVDKCVPAFREHDLDIAFGFYQASVYFDARPHMGSSGAEGGVLDDEGAGDSATVFVHSSAPLEVMDDAAGLRHRIAHRIAQVPRLIDPFNKERACQESGPAQQSPDYEPPTKSRDPNAGLLDCKDPPNGAASEHCQATQSIRQDHADSVYEDLQRMGLSPDDKTITSSIQQCFLLCSPCDADKIYAAKESACDRLVHRAPAPFTMAADEGTIYVLDNFYLENLACRQQGSVCVKSTPLFGLLYGKLDEVYDAGSATKEKVYADEDNPSPLIRQIYELYAMHLIGKVRVYVADDSELGALEPVLKAAMAYNKEVDEVEILVASPGVREPVLEKIGAFVDVWQGEVCPDHGRSHTAPYKVDVVDPRLLGNVEDGGGNRRRRRRRRRDMEEGEEEEEEEEEDLGADEQLVRFVRPPRHDLWEFVGL
eukprot:UC1_evm1s399